MHDDLCQCGEKDFLNSPSSNYSHEAHLVNYPVEVVGGDATKRALQTLP